jgi:hypothetical protein
MEDEKEFDLRFVETLNISKFYRNTGIIHLRDRQGKYCRMKPDVLLKILKFQIRTLQIKHKYGYDYLVTE